MKSFYEFLINEAPQTPPPPAAKPTAGGTSGGSPPPPSSGSLGGGPPLGLGGPPMGGGLPPMGPGPSLGGGPPSMDPSMGGPTGGQPSGAVAPQKIVVSNVWQALEKIIKNKNGQKQEKVVNSEQI